MTIYYSRQPPGGSAPVDRAPDPAPGPVRRWWTLAAGTVITAGSLASAVAAVLALWPDADPDDSARFTAVRITSDVPLGEYRQRSVAAQPVGAPPFGPAPAPTGAGPAVLAVGLPGTFGMPAAPAPPGGGAGADLGGPAGADAGGGTGPAPPVGRSGTSGQSGSSSPSGPSAPPTPSGPSGPDATAPAGPSTPGGEPPVEQPPSGPAVFTADEPRLSTPHDNDFTDEQYGKMCEPLGLPPRECLAEIAALRTFGQAMSTDPQGEPVPPDEAAQRVAKVLKQSRKAPRGNGAGNRREPLGVVVTVDVELSGLRGRTVLLSWSMWQTGGHARLYGDWLNSNLAYRLRPGSDRDTASLDFWVPLPRGQGPYFIRSSLVAEGITLASQDSDPFL